MNLENKIRPYLDNLLMTNDELIKKLNVSRATYYIWKEKDVKERSLNEIIKISKILKVNPIELLSEEFEIKVNEQIKNLQYQILLLKELTQSRNDVIDLLKEKYESK